jgi:transcription-repair coupling factor (superfamily II helicase)
VPLTEIIPLLERDEWVIALLEAVERLPLSRVLEIDDLPVAARAAVIATLLTKAHRPTVIVTSRLDTAEEMAGLLSEYLDVEPLVWPVAEALPYEQLPLDRTISARRVETLLRLLDDQASVIVAPARALTQIVNPPEQMSGERLELKVGQRLHVNTFVASALEQGYEFMPMVTEPGQISRRGGILDIFPPASEHAVRIDLFGDEIDSIRTFDPDTQRSIDTVQTFSLLPPLEISLARAPQATAALRQIDSSALRPEVEEEWQRLLLRTEHRDVKVGLELLAPYLVEQTATLLDYLPDDHLLLVVEPAAVRLAVEQLEAQSEELREALESAGELPLGLRRTYLNWHEITEQLARTRQIAFGAIPIGWAPSVALPVAEDSMFSREMPSYAGRVDRLVERVRELLREEWSIVVVTEQAIRLRELFEEQEIFPRVRAEGQSRKGATMIPPSPGTIEVRHGRLNGGWANDEVQLLVLTDREIFGYRHVVRTAPKRRFTAAPQMLERLEAGSFVVHSEHGIAKYSGIVRLSLNDVEREYLLLEYAENDRLYLPVDQIDRITPYEGGGIAPKLTRLGSPEWNRVKQRVRQSVREIAFDLLQLYAARESAQGTPLSPDSVWDQELEESFAFNETVDQLKAIQDVKRDLEQIRPMDRLVCGDVGYGKTEVALRAAFKAANSGFQVAVLVPTTILALQHLRSFRERLAPFPVRVEMLSRLRTRQEQKQIIEGLHQGEIDIVVGTHRMLQNDVEFRRLGLLVIDEEQRFGVTHKEMLKRARTDVHVLTMTATPIPRTLYMALSGIRDLSVINTPPRDRTPIRTFVTPTGDRIIREAILREMNRGGQVYFVHNRVQSIYQTLRHLQQLVPEAKFGVGHGQMDEHELEKVMLSFVENEFDVLICTTIIESGVDIPNVNTVIIDHAHQFGLTQLYQLRGRVGRSHHRAYAYLLYDDKRALSIEAVQRLEAIQEATELGAGFQIALRDLEIRGAGNILGAEQSGHIAAVGFDLYTRMLATAVEEVREGRPIVEPEPVSVDLPVDAIIPETYTGDENVRVEIYKKFASVKSYGELRDLQDELIDRFGPMPEQVERLTELARLRIRAGQLGVTSIIEREGEVYIRPVLGGRLNQVALRHDLGQGVFVTPNQVRLVLSRLEAEVWNAVLAVVQAIEESDATVLATAD